MFRLSSLGDVILASSALEALPPGEKVTWVVKEAYAPLLRGHPKVREVVPFRSGEGLRGWIRLCRKLSQEEFDEMLDLQGSLRTRLARVLFWIWRMQKNRTPVKWTAISKYRLRLWALYLLKRFAPRSWLPPQKVEEFARAAGGVGSERPQLTHLLSQTHVELPYEDQQFICVMPSSKWEGKQWPARFYFELSRKFDFPVVVLGQKGDENSIKLIKLLEMAQVPFVSGLGKWGLSENAQVLSRSKFYLGADTGLAHLAESVGTPVLSVWGPTTPEMGFAPWHKESRVLGSSLWCRPCGKDGRFCFRWNNRYACLNSFQVRDALAQIED